MYVKNMQIQVLLKFFIQFFHMPPMVATCNTGILWDELGDPNEHHLMEVKKGERVWACSEFPKSQYYPIAAKWLHEGKVIVPDSSQSN